MLNQPPMIRAIHPVLAPWRDIAPYFDRIDATQVYANGGDCLEHLENRLAHYFGIEEGQILCTSNGTAALQMAILAQTRDTAPNTYCLMPSWNFTAVPAAAFAARLQPFFVDVDRTTWALTPSLAKTALGIVPGPVSCVVVVSPFGYPINPLDWDQFTQETGIPVVIDGAGMFVSCQFAQTPVVVSLHATKCFGIGEGGFIGTTDPDLLHRLKCLRNFGMDEHRLSTYIGTNAKLSEYSAAIGLAQLDAWPAKKQQLQSIAQIYDLHLSKVPGISVLPGYGQIWFSGNLVIDLHAPIAYEAQNYLYEQGIESRFWWRQGCHTQKAYEHCPRTLLPVTDDLALSTIGIPFTQYLTEADIHFICKTTQNFLSMKLLKSCA